MTEPSSEDSPNPASPTTLLSVFFGRILVPGLITFAGIAIAFAIFKTRPTTETAAPVRTARLVETLEIFPSSYQVEIEAMGLVKAKNRVELRPRIAGEIVFVAESVVPGETSKKGTLLFRIDPADYQISLRNQQASLQQANANLMLERGQQRIAAIDFEMIAGELSPEELDLVLRKPQLLQAEATAQSAQASLEQAELNLSRTEIFAPFDALILERNASLGSVVNTATNLAALVDSSEFWVELTLPVRDTQWIPKLQVPDGEAITVTLIDQLAWGDDAHRMGTVAGLSLEVDPESRMATVVVAVQDPLALSPDNKGKPPLLLGSFVRGIIKGETLDEVVVVHRDHLRQGNILWTLDDDNRLVFSNVEVLYSGTENVIVRSNLKSGTRLVTSNLSVPVEGMLLRHEEGVDRRTSPASRTDLQSGSPIGPNS